MKHYTTLVKEQLEMLVNAMVDYNCRLELDRERMAYVVTEKYGTAVAYLPLSPQGDAEGNPFQDRVLKLTLEVTPE